MPRLRAADERAGAGARARRTRYRNPHGLDEPGHVSTAADSAALLRAALRVPIDPPLCGRGARDALGRPGGRVDRQPHRPRLRLRRREDRPHDAGGLVAGGVRPRVRSGRHGGGARRARRRRSATATSPRCFASACRAIGRRASSTRDGRMHVSPSAGGSSPWRSSRRGRSCGRLPTGRPLVERVVVPAVASLPVVAGQRLGTLVVRDGSRVVARSPLVAATSQAEPSLTGKGAVGRWTCRRSPRGARSRDRHRHPQRRARPFADRPDPQARAAAPRERGPDARRRQGHQRRARAEAARPARRRDRARGRTHGHAHRRGAHRRGDPQRLRPDRGRVADLDARRRPDVRDPDGDQRVGARRSPSASSRR